MKLFGRGRKRSGDQGSGTRVFDKDDPRFWREILPASTISLSDDQALEDAMDQGRGVTSLDYAVRSIVSVKELDGLAEWRFFDLEGSDQDLWLVAKIVEPHVQLCVLFEPPEFPPDTRAGLLAAGQDWMFDPDRDPESVRPADLELTHEILQGGEDENGEQWEVVYRLKPQGVMYGHARRFPADRDENESFALVAEYSTADPCANPEVMIWELGGEHDANGGLVHLLMGTVVGFQDVDVLKMGQGSSS